MSTYEETPYHNAAYYPKHSGEILAFRSAARTYANGDLVRYWRVRKDIKITFAQVLNEELDSNVSPTATGKLRVTDGTTPQNLVSLSAAGLGAADNSTLINIDDALGFVVPGNGYYIELVFDAAFATAASGKVAVAVGFSAVNYGSESPFAPSG